MTFHNLPGPGTELRTHTLTIANGATSSDSLELRGEGLVGFLMPAAFTGASVSFTGSTDGTNFNALYNADNTAFSIVVAVDRRYCLSPQDFLGMRQVRFVSASAEGAARTIIAVTRSFQ